MLEREMQVSLVRTGPREFLGRNSRGVTVRIGPPGSEGAFTPVELFQLAVASCMSMTVEPLVMDHADGEVALAAVAGYSRAPGVWEVQKIWVDLDVDLAPLEADVRDRVVTAMRLAVKDHCVMARTVEKGAEVGLAVTTGSTASS